MRREWIEMAMEISLSDCKPLSPSMRREWIEMHRQRHLLRTHGRSPSMRREWIEMIDSSTASSILVVSLHAEGVD